MNPWIWATGAVVIAILEVLAPGYYLIWIAAGAAVTAIVEALAEPSLSVQLTVFAAASTASCIAGHFVYQRLKQFRIADSPLNQRGQAMIGARGVVCDALANGHGKVRLGDGVWLAEGPDLSAGTPIVVRGVRNTIVIVERATDS